MTMNGVVLHGAGCLVLACCIAISLKYYAERGMFTGISWQNLFSELVWLHRAFSVYSAGRCIFTLVAANSFWNWFCENDFKFICI